LFLSLMWTLVPFIFCRLARFVAPSLPCQGNACRALYPWFLALRVFPRVVPVCLPRPREVWPWISSLSPEVVETPVRGLFWLPPSWPFAVGEFGCERLCLFSAVHRWNALGRPGEWVRMVCRVAQFERGFGPGRDLSFPPDGGGRWGLYSAAFHSVFLPVRLSQMMAFGLRASPPEVVTLTRTIMHSRHCPPNPLLGLSAGF